MSTLTTICDAYSGKCPSPHPTIFPPPPSPHPLPYTGFTGGDLIAWVLFAAISIGLGVLFYRSARRRK